MVVMVLVAALAAAPEMESPVDEGVRLYEALQFERAALMLKRAAADSTLSDVARARANLYLGLSAAQLLDEAGTREAFARAAELDPHVRLPAGVSPKVERAFRQALDLAAKRAVHMEVILPTGAANTEMIPVEVRTTPPGRVTTVRLFVRREGDEAYNATVLESAGNGVFRGKLQARTPAIEVYAEADSDGARRAVFAGPETPARVPVSARMVFVPTEGPQGPPPPPPTTPLYKQWWLYAIILVVAAGAAAGTYYAVTRPPPCGAGPGDGCIWINIHP